MADAMTKITDVLQSQAFKDYARERTVQLNALISSGIMKTDPMFNDLFNDRAFIVDMPFWKPISGDSVPLSDSAGIETKKVTGNKQSASKILRGQGFAFSDLAVMTSGTDLEKYLADQFAEYWNGEVQKSTIAILNGLFKTNGALASSHLEDKSTEVITSDIILDAKQRLGDHSSKLVALAMHSAMKTKLEKMQLIDYVADATNPAVRFPTYMGYRVIVDDNCPVQNGVYTTYLFGEGALAYGQGVQFGMKEYETARDAKHGSTDVYTRRGYIIHPYGLAWKGSSTSSQTTPSNTELATANKWEKVYEDKNIPLVAIKSRISSEESES